MLGWCRNQGVDVLSQYFYQVYFHVEKSPRTVKSLGTHTEIFSKALCQRDRAQFDFKVNKLHGKLGYGYYLNLWKSQPFIIMWTLTKSFKDHIGFPLPSRVHKMRHLVFWRCLVDKIEWRGCRARGHKNKLDGKISLFSFTKWRYLHACWLIRAYPTINTQNHEYFNFHPWRVCHQTKSCSIWLVSTKQRHPFANKGLCCQSYYFSYSHIWNWESDHKEGWAPKNWCFQNGVLEKTLESPLDSKEIRPVRPKGNQHWIFIGRTHAEADALILWPLDANSWFSGKDPEAWEDWRQKEKGAAKDEVDSITDSMDMNLSKLWEIAEDRKVWHAAVHGVSLFQEASSHHPPPYSYKLPGCLPDFGIHSSSQLERTRGMHSGHGKTSYPQRTSSW